MSMLLRNIARSPLGLSRGLSIASKIVENNIRNRMNGSKKRLNTILATIFRNELSGVKTNKELPLRVICYFLLDDCFELTRSSIMFLFFLNDLYYETELFYLLTKDLFDE